MGVSGTAEPTKVARNLARLFFSIDELKHKILFPINGNRGKARRIPFDADDERPKIFMSK